MVSERLHQALSALADGRASAQDWAEIEAAWPHQPELQARWAEMAWIADGLRSSELLIQRSDERAVLKALPTSAPPPERRRDGWTAVAVAAGFALVALLVPQLRTEDAPVEVAAQAAPSTSLTGPSFAQAAMGRSPGAWPHLPAAAGVREAGIEVAPPIDYVMPSPPAWANTPAASQPQRWPRP